MSLKQGQIVNIPTGSVPPHLRRRVQYPNEGRLDYGGLKDFYRRVFNISRREFELSYAL